MELVRARALSQLAVAALLASSCSSLPATRVPTCAQQQDVVCRAPVEAARSYEWEAGHVCPDQVHGFKHAGCCYVYAGARDERQLYRWRWCEESR